MQCLVDSAYLSGNRATFHTHGGKVLYMKYVLRVTQRIHAPAQSLEIKHKMRKSTPCVAAVDLSNTIQHLDSKVE